MTKNDEFNTNLAELESSKNDLEKIIGCIFHAPLNEIEQKLSEQIKDLGVQSELNEFENKLGRRIDNSASSLENLHDRLNDFSQSQEPVVKTVSEIIQTLQQHNNNSASQQAELKKDMAKAAEILNHHIDDSANSLKNLHNRLNDFSRAHEQLDTINNRTFNVLDDFVKKVSLITKIRSKCEELLAQQTASAIQQADKLVGSALPDGQSQTAVEVPLLISGVHNEIIVYMEQQRKNAAAEIELLMDNTTSAELVTYDIEKSAIDIFNHDKLPRQEQLDHIVKKFQTILDAYIKDLQAQKNIQATNQILSRHIARHEFYFFTIIIMQIAVLIFLRFTAML